MNISIVISFKRYIFDISREIVLREKKTSTLLFGMKFSGSGALPGKMLDLGLWKIS